MAPVRRYLRISKYSVLECRIYLDNPALAQSWLLNPRYDVLPRVIEAVRPLVLPKIREEREKERAKKKSTKKSRIKDVILRDDFEVSIFLMETSTRHSILTKRKNFREKGPSMMQSNSSKLIDETNDQPLDVDEEDFAPIRVEEESDEEGRLRLADIPVASDTVHGKRDRADSDDQSAVIDVDSDEDAPRPKRLRSVAADGESEDDDDDKKKMAMDVSYEGFAIYGRVLCLVVKRRGETRPSQASATGSKAATSGQANMDNFLMSTQVPLGEEE